MLAIHGVFNNKKVLGLILARGASKRLPRKNLRQLNGKPLIDWSIAEAQESAYIDSVVVSTEDIEIKLLNGEQHAEFKQSKKNLEYIADLVNRKKVDYDHKAKSEDYKYSNEFTLKTVSIDSMPLYLRKNVNKYNEWLISNPSYILEDSLSPQYLMPMIERIKNNKINHNYTDL